MFAASAELARLLPSLEEEKRAVLADIVSSLVDIGSLQAFVVHGSYTRGTNTEGSDIDAIVVVDTLDSALSVVKQLPAIVRRGVEVSFDSYTEKFPWFGRLWSFYCQKKSELSLDIGIITQNELRNFFVEPNAIVIFDRLDAVAMRREQCYRERLAAQSLRSKAIEFNLYHALVKVGCSLERGHIWNAIEYVAVLRRILFELIRLQVDPPGYVHVGRAERDIETAVPWVSYKDWSELLPSYDEGSVIRSSLAIAKEIRERLAERGVGDVGLHLDAAATRLSVLLQNLDEE